jgi:hypothetical protein
VVTQDKSKVLRETEQNPFQDDEEDEPSAPSAHSHSRQASLASSQAQSSRGSTPPVSFFSSSNTGKSKKDKDKKKKKSKPFNLEAEKETMKNCIAESSVASTNLLNALRLINREREQISENQNAVQHFEFCKLLRRKILRYVSYPDPDLPQLLNLSDPTRRSRRMAWRPSPRQRRARHRTYDLRAARQVHRC